MVRLGARCGLLLLALLLAGCSIYGPPRPGEKIYHNVVFASPGGHDLRMDLYVPKSAHPVPVVMWIFGGCWRFGSKSYHVNVRDLTSAGIAVASIQYRTSNIAVYPAQLDDCRAALQWLRENGARYGLDPQRIGASGESAGGHLATLLGGVEGKSRIGAVCALYAPSDLVALGRLYAKRRKLNYVEKLLGGPMEQKLKLAASGSPINYIGPNMPPCLLIHGDHDHVVPLEESERLFLAQANAGVQTQLLVVPDKGHWFRLGNPEFAEVSLFFQHYLAPRHSR
jgi:acetyl esterase/lipase